VLTEGRLTKPRGRLTKEIIGASFTIANSSYGVITSPTRKINPSFMAAEFLWIILGLNDASMITPFNKKIGDYSDDGVTFNGAYGPKVAEQLPYVIRTLKQDPDSRQALLTLWRERPMPSKDIPCTTSMQFFIREGYLDMVTYMRSNDLWLGLPYDVFNFTMIQQYVARAVNAIPGEYHHHVGSFHLYEPDWEKARAVVDEKLGLLDLPSPSITYPYWPSLLAYFAGFAGWGQGADADNVRDWLDKAGLEEGNGWDDLIKLCAYRFHKDPALLPGNWGLFASRVLDRG
jgi:thymidylate synthase